MILSLKSIKLVILFYLLLRTVPSMLNFCFANTGFRFSSFYSKLFYELLFNWFFIVEEKIPDNLSIRYKNYFNNSIIFFIKFKNIILKKMIIIND